MQAKNWTQCEISISKVVLQPSDEREQSTATEIWQFSTRKCFVGLAHLTGKSLLLNQAISPKKRNKRKEQQEW